MSSSLSLTSLSLSTIAIILHRHCHRCHHRPPPPHRRLSLIAIMWLIAAWCCLLLPPLSITAAADVIVVILLVVHSCRCHHRSPPLTPMSSSSTANLSSFVPDCHHVVDCYVARFGGGKGARCHPCHLALPSTMGLRGVWAANLMGMCWPWFDCLCFYRETCGVH